MTSWAVLRAPPAPPAPEPPLSILLMVQIYIIGRTIWIREIINIAVNCTLC
jgi:hypothetical protein